MFWHNEYFDKDVWLPSVSAYGGIVKVNTYTIDLCFQNGYKIANLQVMSDEANSDFDYDVLIGMDVITEGDFCVSTQEEKTHFFFRMPAAMPVL